MIGYAITGSYCTHNVSLSVLESLAKRYEIIPIFSENVSVTDTRFGTARELHKRVKEITGREPIVTIADSSSVPARETRLQSLQTRSRTLR